MARRPSPKGRRADGPSQRRRRLQGSSPPRPLVTPSLIRQPWGEKAGMRLNRTGQFSSSSSFLGHYYTYYGELPSKVLLHRPQGEGGPGTGSRSSSSRPSSRRPRTRASLRRRRRRRRRSREERTGIATRTRANHSSSNSNNSSRRPQQPHCRVRSPKRLRPLLPNRN